MQNLYDRHCQNGADLDPKCREEAAGRVRRFINEKRLQQENIERYIKCIAQNVKLFL